MKKLLTTSALSILLTGCNGANATQENDLESFKVTSYEEDKKRNESIEKNAIKLEIELLQAVVNSNLPDHIKEQYSKAIDSVANL